VKEVKRRAKLSGAYLAAYERALAWAALPSDEKALMGTTAHSDVGVAREGLTGLTSDSA
jgi:hypothetical protein